MTSPEAHKVLEDFTRAEALPVLTNRDREDEMKGLLDAHTPNSTGRKQADNILQLKAVLPFMKKRNMTQGSYLK